MTARRILAAAIVACAALGPSPAGAEHGSRQPAGAPPGGQRPASSEGLPAVPEARRALPGERSVPAEACCGLAAERGTFDVDVDVQVGPDGFRLGGRVLGPQGVWGAWLNGTARRDGFTLGGRMQRPDRATNFKFDLDVKVDLDVVEPPRRARSGRSL